MLSSPAGGGSRKAGAPSSAPPATATATTPAGSEGVLVGRGGGCTATTTAVPDCDDLPSPGEG
jgi:hypothetical protein